MNLANQDSNGNGSVGALPSFLETPGLDPSVVFQSDHDKLTWIVQRLALIEAHLKQCAGCPSLYRGQSSQLKSMRVTMVALTLAWLAQAIGFDRMMDLVKLVKAVAL